MEEIQKAFFKLKDDPVFISELQELYWSYIGRPTPLIHAKNLSKYLWWANIYIKNEGLAHTWAHKINHVVWQLLIAKYLWKKHIIAETGAGQHWLATASACAKMWLKCTIYMWKKDYERQRPNVYYMKLAWAKVVPVTQWQQSLRDAVNAGMQALISNSRSSYYLLWTACGPHPYPSMNVFFQKIIWEEVKKQIPITPDYLIACLGWGSNSLWLFYDFLDMPEVQMIWVEAGGKWIHSWQHAARFLKKQTWILQWYKSYFLQDKNWQIENTHSISAGLDYAWVSPQISYLENIWRIQVNQVNDSEVLNALQILMKYEGILWALESCHAIAHTIKLAPKLSSSKNIVVWLSWRGDKDLFITAPKLDKQFKSYLRKQF
jgi:tryptophan synthase beta chain